MMGSFARSIILVLGMLSAVVGAHALKPTKKIADQLPKIDLEVMIPRGFGEWKVDNQLVPVMPAPDVQAKLNAIYNQTLSRTYVNAAGQRIMLSIAYGGDQGGDGTQVHRPEFCYRAQGFEISKNSVGGLQTTQGGLPVRRLMALMGPRHEPITYWVTVGDKATLPGIRRKISQIAYGISGKVPDGMLVRVSSIDPDAGHAYRIQELFVTNLLDAMRPEDRVRITGNNLQN